MYLRARYYQPAVGRFLTRDTYTGEEDEPESLHLYTYCENDGINNIDSTGNKVAIAQPLPAPRPTVKRKAGPMPKPSPAPKKSPVITQNYNCYAYAVGDYTRWMHPGHGYSDYVKGIYCLTDMPRKYSVKKLRKWVLDDFSKARKLKNRKGRLKKGEYRIAMKIIKGKDFTRDFHFWKQSPKTKEWWNKHGQNKIQKIGKVNPDKKKNVGWKLGENEYYNSKTLYIALKAKFWTKPTCS